MLRITAARTETVQAGVLGVRRSCGMADVLVAVSFVLAVWRMCWFGWLWFSYIFRNSVTGALRCLMAFFFNIIHLSICTTNYI